MSGLQLGLMGYTALWGPKSCTQRTGGSVENAPLPSIPLALFTPEEKINSHIV